MKKRSPQNKVTARRKSRRHVRTIKAHPSRRTSKTGTSKTRRHAKRNFFDECLGKAASSVVGARVGLVVGILDVEQGQRDEVRLVESGNITEAKSKTKGKGRAGGLGLGRQLRSKATLKAMGRTLDAMGHSVRLAILSKLFTGPATYQSLCKATQQRSGPLYHHVHQLRIAGMIRPKERDLYEITRGGRNSLLIGYAISKLSRDRRRRSS